ncbi:MAG: (2Fe-2S)-binding protein [Planctomycetota bacterium]|nr:(2Fe-2S)-binding protein [Planctomycetota bacterium]
MRIKEHPILKFKKGRKVEFYFEGKKMTGYEGESVAAALLANGVKVFRLSKRLNRPRGFFCAIGRCASCNMLIDGQPNTRACITPLREGMDVRKQEGRGRIER